MNQSDIEFQKLKLQECKDMSSKIETNQCKLTEIKTLCKNLNDTEFLLREKIHLKRQELEIINSDLTNVIDTYTQIINLSLQKVYI